MDIKEIQLWIDMSDEIGDATDANIGRFALLRDRQAKEKDSEIEALRAKLADGQAVIRHKGHDKICPALFCQRCFIARTSYEHWAFVGDAHDFEPGPCSESCGHDRTTGEKA